MKIFLSMIQLNDFTPLPENEYDQNILRDENERGFFLTHTYFRGADKNFYVPAFSLPVDGGDYKLAFSAEKDGANFKLFRVKNNFYYDSAIGYATAGLTYIFVLKNGKIYGKIHRLIVIPNEMTLAEYEAMIREIIFIRRELLQRGGTDSKAAFSEKVKSLREVEDWAQILQRFSNQVEDLTRIIRRIDQQPREGLRKVQKYLRLEQIRKFDGKIFQQYVSMPQRKNYRVYDSEVSPNIFENRLLLDKLTRLKIFLEKQNRQQNLNSDNSRQNIFYEIQSIIGNFTGEELMAKWRAYEKAKYDAWKNFEKIKCGIVENFRANFAARQDKPVAFETRTLKLTFKEIENTRIYLDNGVKIIFRPNFSNEPILNFNGKQCRWEEFTSKIAAAAQILALFKTFTEDNYAKKNIELTGKFGFTRGVRDGSVCIFIYSLEKIIANGAAVSFETDADKKLEEIFVAQEIEKYTGYETALLDFRAVQDINQRLNKNNRGVETENLFDKIIANLNACLSLKIFRGVELKTERWHMTQIFTNDANYHRAYVKLRELDEIFDFSFDVDDKNIPAQTMYQIYEWWILAKIIEFLVVKLNWRVEGGGDNPVEIFRNLFNANKFLTQGKVLLTNGDMALELYYNVDINESIGASNRKLRPDFLFKVTANDKTKFFILDAKYRNYAAQGENFWAAEDLKGVCENKYIREIKAETGADISMSFIVHSDKTRGNKFLGKYVTYNATVEPKIQEQFKNIRGGRQQIGSFYLLPYDGETLNQSEINLTLFFKLMFEYFLGCWTICWECGSDLVDVTPLLTKGKYEKYYMRCEKCGAFWVKTHCHSCHNHLIKHYINYHVEQSKWLVRCPNCGN